MIVILCNSFDDAKDAYDELVEFLNTYEPWHIKETYNASYCVETDDDLRYIFIDFRLKGLFPKDDQIDVSKFFEGLDDFYGNVTGNYL